MLSRGKAMVCLLTNEILNTASSRVVKAFTDVILNQHNHHIGMVLYLIQVMVFFFCCYISSS